MGRGQAADTASLAAFAARGTPRASVLVVEDDPDLRSLIGRALARDAAHVVECSEATAVERWVERNQRGTHGCPVDLLVADIRLPGMNGLGLVRRLRAAGMRFPVILFSGCCDVDVRQEAARLDIAAFVEKPIDLDALRSLVRRVLDESRGLAPGAG